MVNWLKSIIAISLFYDLKKIKQPAEFSFSILHFLSIKTISKPIFRPYWLINVFFKQKVGIIDGKINDLALEIDRLIKADSDVFVSWKADCDRQLSIFQIPS
jgi:hypothetical protein